MIEWKRQHIAAIVIGFFNHVKELIFSFIVIFIFGQTSQNDDNYYLFIIILLFIFSVLSGSVKWWYFKYKLENDELQIRQGLIQKKHRYIRKERVQSIDINAKLLQRLFGLVEVRIETAGGGAEPEFRLIALNKDEAAMIKRALLEKEVFEKRHVNVLSNDEEIDDEENDVEYGHKEVVEEEASKVTWNLTNKRLMIAAVTSSGIGIAATFVAIISSQAHQFIPEHYYDQFISFVLQSSILFITIWIVLILLISWIFTVTKTVLKYGKFQISKQGDKIHISRGILETRQLTLSDKRITTVRIVQSLLRQPFQYVSVYVESAGGGRAEEDLSTMLIPLCKKEEVNTLLEEMIPEFAYEREYERLPKKSLRRYMIRLLVPNIVAATIVTYFFTYGWLSLCLPIGATILGYWQYSDAGIGNDERLLFLKRRSLSLTEIIIPRKRIQAMNMTQHPFQRWDDLYTIHASVLTSITGKTFSLRHISNTQKEKLLQWYAYKK